MTNSKAPQGSVLILDDHVIIRRGFRNLISSRMPLLIVEDCSSLETLMDRLSVPPLPDMIVLDLQLADGNAMERIDELITTYPSVRLLVYSMSPERIYAQRVLAMGCAGYVNKGSSEDEVIRAVQAVLAGGIHMGSELETRLMEQARLGGTEMTTSPFDLLSGQELRVLNDLLAGIGVKEISTRMNLGVSTVATYKARLFEKLGVTNLMQMQALALVHRYPLA